MGTETGVSALETVKRGLGITTDDEDVNRLIEGKYKACIAYLKAGGAKRLLQEPELDDSILECITIGVNDLLNAQSGKTEFSPAFKMLATQICSRG